MGIKENFIYSSEYLKLENTSALYPKEVDLSVNQRSVFKTKTVR